MIQINMVIYIACVDMVLNNNVACEFGLVSICILLGNKMLNVYVYVFAFNSVEIFR